MNIKFILFECALLYVQKCTNNIDLENLIKNLK